MITITFYSTSDNKKVSVIAKEGSVGDGGVWWNDEKDTYHFIPFHRLIEFKSERIT